MAALGELGSVGRNQQRQMRELRRRVAGGFENQHVLVGVRKMILAANDVADAQVGIVGAGGQVIGRHPIGAQQGEVFNVGACFDLLAVNGIGEANHVAGIARHAKTESERFSGSGPAIAFLA